MSKTLWIRNSIATSLAIALFVTTSMISLASTPGNQLMAELNVTGTSADGDAPSVSVNGERAFSGRTIQPSTTVTTPATSSATINLGKLGRVELAPNSSLVINFNENSINGNLVSGKVKVVGAAGAETSIQTKDSLINADKMTGKAFAVSATENSTLVTNESGSVVLNSNGKSSKVDTGATKSSRQDDDNGDIVPGSVTLYAIIFGAAAATLIYIATRDTNEFQLGTGTTIVSPGR